MRARAGTRCAHQDLDVLAGMQPLVAEAAELGLGVHMRARRRRLRGWCQVLESLEARAYRRVEWRRGRRGDVVLRGRRCLLRVEPAAVLIKRVLVVEAVHADSPGRGRERAVRGELGGRSSEGTDVRESGARQVPNAARPRTSTNSRRLDSHKMASLNAQFCSASSSYLAGGLHSELDAVLESTAKDLASSLSLRCSQPAVFATFCISSSSRREGTGSAEPTVWKSLAELWEDAARHSSAEEEDSGLADHILVLAKFTRNLVAGCAYNQTQALYVTFITVSNVRCDCQTARTSL
jgi:hypothetical protein